MRLRIANPQNYLSDWQKSVSTRKMLLTRQDDVRVRGLAKEAVRLSGIQKILINSLPPTDAPMRLAIKDYKEKRQELLERTEVLKAELRQEQREKRRQARKEAIRAIRHPIEFSLRQIDKNPKLADIISTVIIFHSKTCR